MLFSVSFLSDKNKPVARIMTPDGK